MSIEVKVPEEIENYKESVLLGLSIRQLACTAIAIGCGIPTFLFLKPISFDLATYLTMAVTTPAFCIGYIKINGYNFETYMKIRLNSMFSKKRKFQTEENINYHKGGTKNVPIKKDETKRYESEFIQSRKKGYKRERKAAYKKIRAKAKGYKPKKQGTNKKAKKIIITADLSEHHRL